VLIRTLFHLVSKAHKIVVCYARVIIQCKNTIKVSSLLLAYDTCFRTQLMRQQAGHARNAGHVASGCLVGGIVASCFRDPERIKRLSSGLRHKNMHCVTVSPQNFTYGDFDFRYRLRRCVGKWFIVYATDKIYNGVSGQMLAMDSESKKIHYLHLKELTNEELKRV
jgi:hypothetical protein